MEVIADRRHGRRLRQAEGAGAAGPVPARLPERPCAAAFAAWLPRERRRPPQLASGGLPLAPVAGLDAAGGSVHLDGLRLPCLVLPSPKVARSGPATARSPTAARAPASAGPGPSR